MGRDVTDETERPGEPAGAGPPTAPPAPTAARKSRRGVVAAVVVAIVVVIGGGSIAIDRLRSGAHRATQPAASGSPSASPTASIPVNTVFKCTFTPLTTPKGVDIDQLAIDPTGHYIVNNLPVVLWTDGKPKVLGPGSQAVATAVNAQGVVVGNLGTTGWMFRDGKRIALPKLAGYASTVANAINGAGDIVGYAYNRAGPWAAVIWPAAQPGTAVRLVAPADPHGAEAFGINDAGTVVGTVGDGKIPYVWAPGGAGRPLTNPPHTTRGKAFAISGDWVTGEVAPVPDPKNYAVAARWNLVTGESVVFAGQTFPGYGVTATGEVLIPFTNPANQQDPESAVILGSTSHRVPGPTTGKKAVYANSITSDGRLIVGSLNDTHSNEAVVWHC